MKFTVAGSRLVCSRKDSTVEDDDVYRQVVEFDARVDSVPPHVAARLTTGEIAELEAFIAERKRIQANPTEKNMLEVLPGLLRKATDILQSVRHVNGTTYRQLSASISEVHESLESVKPTRKGETTTPVRKMRESEAQKERLENIKDVL